MWYSILSNTLLKSRYITSTWFPLSTKYLLNQSTPNKTYVTKSILANCADFYLTGLKFSGSSFSLFANKDICSSPITWYFIYCPGFFKDRNCTRPLARLFSTLVLKWNKLLRSRSLRSSKISFNRTNWTQDGSVVYLSFLIHLSFKYVPYFENLTLTRYHFHLFFF